MGLARFHEVFHRMDLVFMGVARLEMGPTGFGWLSTGSGLVSGVFREVFLLLLLLLLWLFYWRLVFVSPRAVQV